jgi:cyclic 2,3-diphosphoglycerate synthetase
MKVVVLVDGEHYPPVTRWAIDELRGRGLDPIAALFVGGGEKLDPSAALDLGIPLQGSVPVRSVAASLAGALDVLVDGDAFLGLCRLGVVVGRGRDR